MSAEDPRERLRRAAAGSAVGRAAQGSVLESMGGTWGIIASVVPSALFVTVFTIASDLRLAIIVALVAGAVMTLVSLLMRRPVGQSIGGLIGVAACAFAAWRTGEAGNYFVIGFWTNGISIAALVISILLRWPLIGVIVGTLSSQDASWREAPRTMRIYTGLTWAWVAVFVLRLGVQLPFYVADDVTVLGTLRLVMGLPLFALMAWFTWLAVRRVQATAAEGPEDEAGRQEDRA